MPSDSLSKRSRRLRIAGITALGLVIAAIITTLAVGFRMRGVPGAEWSLVGFTPNDGSFERFLRAPAKTKTRPGFATETVTAAFLKWRRSSGDALVWTVEGAAPLRAGPDNQGPVEIHGTSDELAVGDVRMRLREIDLFVDGDRTILRYDAQGRPLKKDATPAPVSRWDSERGPRHIRLLFSHEGGELVLDNIRWRDSAAKAQFATPFMISDAGAGNETSVELGCPRFDSGTLEIGFSAYASPSETGDLAPVTGAGLLLGELNLRFLGSSAWELPKTVDRVGITRIHAGYRMDSVTERIPPLTGGFAGMVSLSHLESTRRLVLANAPDTRDNIGAERTGPGYGLYPIWRKADEAKDAPLRFKRLSAAGRFVLKMPSLEIPGKYRAPEDLLDTKYLHWKAMSRDEFKNRVRANFGLHLPELYYGRVARPAAMPSCEGLTLREALVLYFQPALDEHKNVLIFPLRDYDAFVLDDPWWEKTGDWIKARWNAFLLRP